MAKPQNANAVDHAWEMINKVLSFPGRLHSYMLNAIVNTIDKAQTEALLRESAELQRKKSENQSAESE